MLISWGIYTFALILSNLNYHMPGFNCFQDDLLVFVVYFLYYFPNKNIIYDNQYIYSRLLSSKKVFLYYLKIYLKSSLVYFFGINIINLLYCFIAGKELFMWGFISYIAYGCATFMIYNISFFCVRLYPFWSHNTAAVTFSVTGVYINMK